MLSRLWALARAWAPASVPLVCALIAWVLSRKMSARRERAADTLRREVAGAHAHARAQQIERELGRRQAQQHVETEYRRTMADLSSRQRRKAKELLADPAKLARHLARQKRR